MPASSYIAIIVFAILLLGVIAFVLQKRHFLRQISVFDRRLGSELEKQQQQQSKLIELENQISNNVLTDPLTNLCSRKIFEDRLAVTLKQSERYQLTCGVMFLDLDGFKVINEALGYDVGDSLLKAVAGRLVECIRQVDTVSRFGSDEFVFIFPQLAKAETAAYIAQRILDSIAQPFQLDNNDLYLTASIGIAIYPADGADSKMLLKNASSALHQAKLHKNNYQFYRDEMQTLSGRELILNSHLRNENVYQDFSLYYQPQVDITTRSIVSMEAFLRWKHPDFGVIHLEEFISIAENSGKMMAITEWVVRTVATHLTQWHKSGFLVPSISIPISIKQLENPHFIHKISLVMQEVSLSPESVVFEISESTLSVKIEQVEKMLHMLKHLGVRIAINHFGAGHLSLHHLRRLPVDFFKLDKSLIQDMTINKESAAIVKMVIALAKSLSIDIIAEGVESIKQEQLLAQMECRIVQGDIFGAPALPQEFMNRLIGDVTEKV